MPLGQKVTGVGLTGSTAAGSAMATAPAPYDSNLVNFAAVNTIASVTFAAVAGKRWVVASLTAIICSLGVSASVVVDVQILDGAAVIWQGRLAIPAGTAILYNIDRIALSNLAFAGTIGNAVKVQFTGNAGGPNTYEAVSASAYQI